MCSDSEPQKAFSTSQKFRDEDRTSYFRSSYGYQLIEPTYRYAHRFSGWNIYLLMIFIQLLWFQVFPPNRWLHLFTDSIKTNCSPCLNKMTISKGIILLINKTMLKTDGLSDEKVIFCTHNRWVCMFWDVFEIITKIQKINMVFNLNLIF